MTENRSSVRGVRRVLLIVAVLALAAETYLVAGRVVGVPRVPMTPDSILVDGLGKGHRISQTFLLRAGGFHGVRISVSASDASMQGEVALALYEVERDLDGGVVDGQQRFLFRNGFPLRVVTGEPTFLFRFPEIDASAGRSYRLDVWIPEPRPEHDVSLWAIEGRWSEGGSLFVNGQSAYAELVFETLATRGTVWARLRHQFGGAALAALLFLAAGAHVALFVGVRALVTLSAGEA